MKRLLLQLLAFFPTRLPNGIPTFHAWAESFFEIYTLPTSDMASVKFVLADAIMHQPTGTHRLSKRFFYKFLCSAAAKQVAGQVFRDVKEEQKARQKAQAEKNVESTVT